MSSVCHSYAKAAPSNHLAVDFAITKSLGSSIWLAHMPLLLCISVFFWSVVFCFVFFKGIVLRGGGGEIKKNEMNKV